MLSLDSIPRGFELCSTSYTNDSGHRSAWRCAVSRRRADRCGRTPASSRRRLQLVAASEDSEDSDISVYNRPALDLVKGPSGDPDLIRRTISLADAHNGNWAKDFEEFGDWQDFWNDGSTMFEDPALDDTWDGLTFGTALLWPRMQVHITYSYHTVMTAMCM